MINRRANIDMVDLPLNNIRWLPSRFAEILKLPDESGRLSVLHNVVAWTNPGSGGFYDDLCDLANEPHLVRAPNFFESDPGVLHSPADDYELIKDKKFYREYPYRTSWLSRVSTLHGTPLKMRYTDLDPLGHYCTRVVYASDWDEPVPEFRMMTDDGREIHPFLNRPIPIAALEYALPKASTADGELELSLKPKLPEHGNGRGNQIAENLVAEGITMSRLSKTETPTYCKFDSR